MAGSGERQPKVDLFEAALRLLSSRDHSREELRRKLLARGAEEEALAPLLDRLAGLGYLDDARFARQYAAGRARRGLGRARLLEELARRGVDRGVAAEAVAGAGLGDEAERACELARRRAGLGRPREQTARYLLRRGFPASVVRGALDRAFGEP